MEISECNLQRYRVNSHLSPFPQEVITSTKVAAAYLRQFFGDDLVIYESFFLLILNRANLTTNFVKISQGGTTSTIVDVRLVAKFAIDTLAQSVILCHNHPSGNLSPSDADKRITKKIRDGLALFDIQVIDHIILTEDSYFSFGDAGLI